MATWLNLPNDLQAAMTSQLSAMADLLAEQKKTNDLLVRILAGQQLDGMVTREIGSRLQTLVRIARQFTGVQAPSVIRFRRIGEGMPYEVVLPGFVQDPAFKTVAKGVLTVAINGVSQEPVDVPELSSTEFAFGQYDLQPGDRAEASYIYVATDGDTSSIVTAAIDVPPLPPTGVQTPGPISFRQIVPT